MSKNAFKNWKCDICKKVFDTRAELYKHKKENNHSLRAKHEWKCNICEKVFDTRIELCKHKKENNHSLRIRHEWKCVYCDETFESRRKMFKHKKEVHKVIRGKHINDLRRELYCQHCGKLSTTITGLKVHEKSCNNNPNRVDGCMKGFKKTKEQSLKTSIGLKKAYQEGRAQGWMSSHSSHKSYPEKWFEQVIANEFFDKNYDYDLQVGHYAIDFAWQKKKLYIEIDGQQHERDERQKASDIKKDEFLTKRGWKVLRIPWKQCFKNTKMWIKIANDFIGN
jgi:very-short-patch-repair endonuclease